MGGITKPLVFKKKIMDELNFSCDPHASCNVLKYGKNVSVITGNHCLKVLFTKEEYKKNNLLKRLGTTEDIANTVLYLLSEKAAYINGENININGGY